MIRRSIFFRRDPSSMLRCPAGSNAVEFALILPVLVAMFFGLVGYGYYLGASHSLAQLAAESARSALAGLDADERHDLSLALVERSSAEYPLLDPARVSVATEEEGSSFRVTLRYDTAGFPVWSLGLGLVFPDRVIERSAVADVVAF